MLFDKRDRLIILNENIELQLNIDEVDAMHLNYSYTSFKHIFYALLRYI